MDCREAQELLSAVQDGQPLAEGAGASVAAHCATCAECATFDAQVKALRDLGAPKAREGLAGRISAAVAREIEQTRAEQAAAALAVPSAPATASTPAADQGPMDRLRDFAASEPPAWLTRRRLWIGTGTITTAAAAIAVAVVISQPPIDQTALDSTSAGLESAQRSPAGVPAASPDGLGAGTSAPAATSATPNYVVYGGGVYAAATSTETSPSQLTTQGIVKSALNMSTVQSIPVLRSSADSSGIYLRLPGGALQRFNPVLRRRKGASYQLQAGVEVDRYGQWPSLPPNLPTPTAKDGSPTFFVAGTDDSGANVFVRVGDTPERGFAIASGTAPTDPAAGNPNWTWWLPVQ